MENIITYNPEKINIEALKLFLASLITHSSGDLAINPEELDNICKMFKEMVKVYIAKPDAFEHNERPCKYDCAYISCLINFPTGETQYYCRIQPGCPTVDNSCICPYNNDEERQYAENVLKLQSNLNILLNQQIQNMKPEDPIIK